MTAAVLPGDLCRVTVVAPGGRADLALPSTIPLAELIPTLLRYATSQRPTEEAPEWVLQRLGEDPLDEDSTLGALAVRDGEVLHLRPREAAIPSIGFDDVVHGIGLAIAGRADKWRASMTRWLFVAAGVAALLTTLGGLLLPGAAAPRAAGAAAVTLLLLGGAVAWSRAFGDATLATLCGAAALPFAALSGLLAAQAVNGGALLTGAGLAWAGSFGGLLAAVALVAVRVPVPLYAGALATCAGLLAAELLGAGGLRPAQIAAAVAGAAFVVTVLAPASLARVAGLRLPLLPSGPDDLRQEPEAVPQEEVFARTRRADVLISAVFTASSVITIAGSVVLALDPDPLCWALLGVLSVALLLRARTLVSAVQRSAAAAGGAVGAAALLLALLRALPGPVHAALLGGLVVVAGLLLVCARTLPGRTLVPHWGRAADIGETVLAIAVIPLVAGVLGAYSFAHSLLS